MASLDGTNANDHAVLVKTNESLVFEVLKPDGTPLTQDEFQRQKVDQHPADADRERPTSPLDHRLGTTPFQLCAEGDSWINILWPLSAVEGYNESFVDIIEEDSRFTVNNLGWPGDTFEDIVKAEQFKGPIQSGIYDFFILSGGGNDFLGGGSLVNFVKNFSEVGGSATAEECIEAAKLDAIFSDVAKGYHRVLKEVRLWSPNTHIFIHGYDHAIPRVGGKWMGTPFHELGYDLTTPLPEEIIRIVVDKFYLLLAGVAGTDKHVHLVNVRGTLQNHWHDELHPDHEGAILVSKKFIEPMLTVKAMA
ncbi:hypothetical protein G6K86_32210 [Agrobacterium rhizogenes]|nr:hypothetical protein [Rhizobium rhizogenes]